MWKELARLESPEDASSGKIRVKMPNRKINEMFAFAEQILGGRRVTVLCEDGETRMARIQERCAAGSGFETVI